MHPAPMLPPLASRRFRQIHVASSSYINPGIDARCDRTLNITERVVQQHLVVT